MNKVNYIVIGALLAVSISLVVACTVASPPSSASGCLSIDERIGPELSNQDLVAEVAPAVVSTVVETVSYNWFWQAVPETGAESGMIVSPDGYIVPNNHVVEGAQKVTVTLSDGSVFAATMIGTDAQTDLAVVKIDASNLAYLRILCNSLEQLNVLDPVVAVGNALALEGGPTWTTGVVSNLGRSIQENTGVALNDIIQTDAAISAGNSGGPLLNAAGRVIGIYSSYRQQHGEYWLCHKH